MLTSNGGTWLTGQIKKSWISMKSCIRWKISMRFVSAQRICFSLKPNPCSMSQISVSLIESRCVFRSSAYAIALPNPRHILNTSSASVKSGSLSFVRHPIDSNILRWELITVITLGSIGNPPRFWLHPIRTPWKFRSSGSRKLFPG